MHSAGAQPRQQQKTKLRPDGPKPAGNSEEAKASSRNRRHNHYSRRGVGGPRGEACAVNNKREQSASRNSASRRATQEKPADQQQSGLRSSSLPDSRGGGAGRGKGRKHQKRQAEGQSNDELAANAAALDALREEANRAIEFAEMAEREAVARREEEARLAAEALARREQAHAALNEQRKAVMARKQIRALNGNPAVEASRAHHEANKKKLKSDLKRTTAFVKKVKAGMSEEQRTSLTSDVEGLNLTLYVSELVKAVAETRKHKDKDVSVAASVCSALHQRHRDFGPEVVKSLCEVFFSRESTGALVEEALGDPEDAKKRKRASMRLLLELFLTNVCVEESVVVKMLRRIAEAGDAALLVVFCKAAGEDVLGIVPRRLRNLLEVAGEDDAGDLRLDALVLPETRRTLKELALGAYESFVSQLVRDAKALRDLERRCTRDALTHGSLTEQKEKALEEARKAKEKLAANVAALADALDREPPKIDDDEDDGDDVDADSAAAAGISVYTGADKPQAERTGVFDDETSRAFYEDYPNVLDVLPPGLLGFSDAEVAVLQKEREDAKALWRGATLAELHKKDKKAIHGTSAAPTDPSKPTDSPHMDTPLVDDDEPRGDDAQTAASMTKEDDLPQSIQGQITTLLTEELPVCYSRERADAIALKFCDGLAAKKGARKRLVKALFGVPRTAFELLPHYARVAAIVSAAYKDVGSSLVSGLWSEFRYWLRRRSQHTLESRTRNIRFIAELLKFRVAPPSIAFSCLKTCLDDFSHHNVDVACLLFETAGGFLVRSAPTKERATKFLETMMRLKKAKPLNGRDAALVDNAYYQCFPPDAVVAMKKPRSRKYRFLEYLFVVKLAASDEATVEAVIKELRKLPWNVEPCHSADAVDAAASTTQRAVGNPRALSSQAANDRSDPAEEAEQPQQPLDLALDEPTTPLVVKFVLKLARSKADASPTTADVLSGLHRYRPHVSGLVIDAILEEFELALETPASQRPVVSAQRLVAYARLFGELYNFSLVSTQHLLNTMRRIIRKGHEVTDAFRSFMAQCSAYDNRDLAPAVDDVIEEGEEEEDDDDNNSAALPPVKDADDKDDQHRDEEDASKKMFLAPPTRRAKFSLLEHATYDPRVPCSADEPRDFLRVTLTCVILRTCAPCVVAVAPARAPLCSFLDELQRYFYCKPVAPLGPRYALLDCIDELERGAKALAAREKKKKTGASRAKVGAFFPVRESWYEAHDATEAFETATAASAAAKLRSRSPLLGGSGDDDPANAEGSGGVVSREDDDEEVVEEDDDEDEDEDEDGDDDDEDDDEDDEEDEDDDDDEDDDEDRDDDDDDDDYNRGRESQLKSPEDLEFDRAFAAILNESIASSRATAGTVVTASADNMVMPSSIARRVVSTKSSDNLAAQAAAASTSTTSAPTPSFKFQVLRRGAKGRFEARELFVPSDSSLATQVQRNEEAQRREHDDLKANILRHASRMK